MGMLTLFGVMALVLLYHRSSKIVWSIYVAAIIIWWGYLEPSSSISQRWVGLLGGLWLILSHVTWLRLKLLTRPLFFYAKSLLPPMSDTEREAIEAGTVGWEAELFQGRPNFKTLFDYPAPQLTAEEIDFLNGPTEQLCELVNDWAVMSVDYDLPQAAWDHLKTHRFFGMNIPKSYGGLGFSAYAQSTILGKLATKSCTLAVTAMVPNSLGPAELILKYGTEEQKDTYLPRLARSDLIPCFALTGPEAGSDASALPDTGVIEEGEYDGQTIWGVRLNWDKRYITLAPVADVMGLAFQLIDPKRHLGGHVNRGITVCLVPTDLPGITIGRRHMPAGACFQNGPIQGKDVFIPLTAIIGGPAQAGKGWKMLMECLSAGRGISLPALSTATGKLCYRSSGAYAAVREQFNVSIGRFEGIQQPLSRIGGYTYVLEAARQFTAAAVDRGEKPAIASAIMKCHATEWARLIANDAMDIHAGRGLITGPHNYLVNCHSANNIGITVEGANILTRNLIIFGQGAIRCHPYLQQAITAIQQSETHRGVEQLDGVIYAHAGAVLGHLVRTLALGLTKGRLARVPKSGSLTLYLHRMAWMSSGLAFVSDVSLILLGGQLKRREALSARLGDILSNLYFLSAVIHYYRHQSDTSEEKAHMHWIMKQLFYETQDAFYQFFRNYPNRLLAMILKRLVFPWNKAFARPRDELSRDVAQQMMKRSTFRERLTHPIYFKKDLSDGLGAIEWALEAREKAQDALLRLKEGIKAKVIDGTVPLSEKLEQAQTARWLTPDQVQQVLNYERARQAAIRVDDFAPHFFQKESKS